MTRENLANGALGPNMGIRCGEITWNFSLTKGVAFNMPTIMPWIIYDTFSNKSRSFSKMHYRLLSRNSPPFVYEGDSEVMLYHAYLVIGLKKLISFSYFIGPAIFSFEPRLCFTRLALEEYVFHQTFKWVVLALT